jgi:hypothetical protein
MYTKGLFHVSCDKHECCFIVILSEKRYTKICLIVNRYIATSKKCTWVAVKEHCEMRVSCHTVRQKESCT